MAAQAIVVDANIVFSAILRSNGKIADLLLNSQNEFSFIAPEFLRSEIQKHYGRLAKISGMSKAELQDSEFYVTRNIDFISEEQIDEKYMSAAERLVAGIDPKDDIYIAYSMYFACKLWSDDKGLMKGLQKKGYREFFFNRRPFPIQGVGPQKKLKGKTKV
jgi:predicted nucleic acid-binding protein